MANEKQKLTIVLEGDSKKLEKALRAANNALKNTEGNARKASGKGGGFGMLETAFRRLAAYGAAGIAINGVKRFVSDSVTMAASLEGIERQFNAVAEAGGTSLQDLRNATQGTVSDLKLMQATVRASNFNLPLENLAKLFEFARIRAAQTGESVEYLTDSIVLGIGRKSPLILDNLGITMLSLKEAMGKTGKSMATVQDLMEATVIVAEQQTRALKALGLTAQTTGQRLDAMRASLQNIKALTGKDIIEGDVFQRIGQFFSDGLKMTELNLVLGQLRQQLGLTTYEYKEFIAEMSGKFPTLSGIDMALESIKELEARIKTMSDGYASTLESVFPDETEALKSAKGMTELMESTEKLGESISGSNFSPQTIEGLNVAARALYNDAFKKLNEGGTELAKRTEALKDEMLAYGDAITKVASDYSILGDRTKYLDAQKSLLEKTLSSLTNQGFATTEQFKLLKSAYDALIVSDRTPFTALDAQLKELNPKVLDMTNKVKKFQKQMIGEKPTKTITDQISSGDALASMLNVGKAEPISSEQLEKISSMKNLLTGVSTAFNNAMQSGDSFGEIMGAVFKRLLAQITSVLAAAFLLNLLFPTAFANAGGLKGLLSGGGGGGGGSILGGVLGLLSGGGNSLGSTANTANAGSVSPIGVSGGINVNVQGVMRGTDIFLTGERGKNFIGKRLG